MIAFQDLIGQPTWLDDLTVQFKTVMCADTQGPQQITMLPAVVPNTGTVRVRHRESEGHFPRDSSNHELAARRELPKA
jgi:hypothetical protein